MILLGFLNKKKLIQKRNPLSCAWDNLFSRLSEAPQGFSFFAGCRILWGCMWHNVSFFVGDSMLNGF